MTRLMAVIRQMVSSETGQDLIEYGLLAGCLLSAEGLRRMWLRATHKRAVAGLAAGCVAATIAFAFLLPKALGVHLDINRTFYLYVDLVLAGAFALVCLPLLTGWRRLHRWRLVAATAIVAVGVTTRALPIATPAATKAIAGQSLASQTGVPLTGGLYRALTWVRVHSSPSAVIAVSNTNVAQFGWPVPDDFNATQRLVTGLFSAPPGTPTVTALRMSQRQLMDDVNTSHPFYWAAFAAIGDGEVPVIRPLGPQIAAAGK